MRGTSLKVGPVGRSWWTGRSPREDRPLRVHAIYTVLGEADLFAASLASIYRHIQGATVITGYDRDWKGRPWQPDSLVDRVLSRAVDPDRKVSLLVCPETNDARARNRAMDFVSPGRRSSRVEVQHPGDLPVDGVDYFWVIDADEIYDSSTIERIFSYIHDRNRPFYKVAGREYFRYWNYSVEGYVWFTAFVRHDQRCGSSRNPWPNIASKALYRLPHPAVTRSPATRMVAMAERCSGLERIPAEVGFFHHGSYVGPRSRIAMKVAAWTHSGAVANDWVERVWDRWTPAWRNFHPVSPSAFPSAHRIAPEELPSEIRDWAWPEGYLEGAD